MTKADTTKIASLSVALIVLVGITLHDTKLDTLTKFVIALPAVMAVYEGAQFVHLSSDSHTHVERVSLKNTVKKFTGVSPKLQAREEKESKARKVTNEPKGYHPFDNYNLPILA